jgi:hypothetical protein
VVAGVVSNPSKRTGTRHESTSVIWLKRNGWPFARRIVMKGHRDEGDISLGDGIPVTIEAKAEKHVALGEYIKELDAEIVHAGNETGIVIIKRRGTTDVGKYYVLTTVGYWNAMARRVYKKPKRKIIRA